MSSGPEIWIDGRPGNALPLPDRGLEFGDGLFETLLVLNGIPQFTDYHQRRLHRGFERLRFAGPLPDLADLIAPALERASQFPVSALRLTVSRAAAPRGYAPGDSNDHRSTLRLTPMAEEWPMQVAPASLGVSEITLASQPALAGIKHLNRLEQVLAAADRQRLGVDEAITCDEHGKPVAVSSGNLFVRQGNRLLTPPLSHCGIAGTRRALILDTWADMAGYEAVEQSFTLDELRVSDEVFYCNSLVGIRAVAVFGDCRWNDYPASAALQRACQQALATCAG